MQSFREIIDEIGVGRLAEKFGVEASHVRTMKARDSVPSEYWPTLIDELPAARRSELTLERLADMRRRRFDRAAAEVGAPAVQA